MTQAIASGEKPETGGPLFKNQSERQFVLAIVIPFALVVEWVAFAFEPPSWNNPSNSAFWLVCSAVSTALFLVVTGLALIFQKRISAFELTLILVGLASTMLFLYASSYFYLGLHRHFHTKLTRLDSFELAAGNLTQTDITKATATTQSAKVMLLSQGFVDIFFIVVILAIAIAKIMDGSRSMATSNESQQSQKASGEEDPEHGDDRLLEAVPAETGAGGATPGG